MSSSASAELSPKVGSALEPPGGMMIWLFIFLELVAFGAAFGAFVAMRAGELATFEASQAKLDQALGLANTLVLVTSGFLVALANVSYHRGESRTTVRWLSGAIALGVVFMVLKSVEYADKIAHGITTGVNTFFDFYWMLTAFHLAHVLGGAFILAYMARKIHRGETFAAPDFNLTTGSAFWHMCDLIWVLLFPVLYLL